MFNFLKRNKSTKANTEGLKTIWKENTSILWDLENISVNSIPWATEFVKWLKNQVPGHIYAIGQLSHLKNDVKSRLKQLNVDLKDATSSKPNFADIAIINDAYRLARQFTPPHRFCFITKDGDFAETMSQLQDWGYEVWLVTSENGVNSVLEEIAEKKNIIPRHKKTVKTSQSIKKIQPKANQPSKIEEKEYPCTHCTNAFKTVQALKLHTDAKHGKKKCQHCRKQFSTKNELQNHLKSAHKIPCPYCKSEFPTQQTRDKHIRDQHKKYVCPECNGRFSSTKSLSDHKRVKHPA